MIRGESMDKYNDKKPVAKYKVGDRFITTIGKLSPGHNGYGHYVDYMMDIDPNISEKEDCFCGGWLTRQEMLDGMIYLGGRRKDEGSAKDIIDSMDIIEAKEALWRAVQKMEAALTCTKCPVFRDCHNGRDECRERILKELLKDNENAS